MPNADATRQADDLEQMLVSPGWQLVREALREKLSETVRSLTVCDADPAVFTKLQGKYAAYQWCVDEPARMIERLRVK